MFAKAYICKQADAEFKLLSSLCQISADRVRDLINFCAAGFGGGMELKMNKVTPHNNAGIKTNKSKLSLEWGYFVKNLPLTLFALPGIIIVLIFRYIPIYGLILPFKNYRASLGFFKSPWAGIENFKFLFIGDAMLNATKNTILYNLVFIFFGIVIGVAFALMLFEMSRRFVKVYQTVLFLPYFISWVVAAYIFRSLLDMDYGLFNKILVHFGKEPIMWYSEPKYWPALLFAANLWKQMGYTVLIYYASLMGIDRELYEAARIDGAGKIRQMWYISIPMLKPMITMLTILNIGRIFYGDFGLFYNVTLNSSLLYKTTDVIDTFVYRSLIDMGDIGMSSASAFFQSVVGFILVIVTNTVVKKVDEENSLF